MFEDNGVFGSNFEDTIPVGTGFANAPCLSESDLSFINVALTEDDPTLSVIALQKIESQAAFLASVQARLAAHLDITQGGTVDGPVTAKQRGMAHQVAMARRRSQNASVAYVRRMHFLIADLPYLFSRYQHGDFSEKLVMAILAPLEDMSRSERREFDSFFASAPAMFDTASVNEARDLAQKAVDEVRGENRDEDIDRKAEHRGVSFFKGKDCVRLSAGLPIEVGIAVEASLEHEAQQLKNAGDERSIAQLKADLLVSRLTGHPADKPLPIKLHVNLVMTDMALLMDGKEPASMPGYGTVPAQYARRLIETYGEIDDCAPISELAALRRRIRAYPMIRRLYMLPGAQDLVAMDSKERLFKGSLRKLLQLRDPYCRTPYCNNKPRHADHVHQHSKGGKTCCVNGCMKCAFCNLAKEAPGWTEEVVQENPHKIRIHPPGSVTYESSPPPITGLARMDESLTRQINKRTKIPETPRNVRIIRIFPEAS